jgi:hypothetical protein
MLAWWCLACEEASHVALFVVLTFLSAKYCIDRIIKHTITTPTATQCCLLQETCQVTRF